MTTKERQQKITDADRDAAERAILKAALDAFGEHYECDDDEETDDTAKRVVRSLAAASAAEGVEFKRLRAIYGPGVSLLLEAHTAEAVATAFWMWSERVSLDLSDVAPRSIIGQRYLGFAQGMAAASAIDHAVSMMDPDRLAYMDTDDFEILLKRIDKDLDRKKRSQAPKL